MSGPATDDAIPGAVAAAALGVPVEVRDVGPSASLEEHEAKLGVESGSLCKTLVVRRAAQDHVLVVVSGGRRMDWRKVREVLDVKRASMAPPHEVAAVTGFVPGTVTPLGAPRDLPLIIDAVAAAMPLVAVGSGRSGVSLLVEPSALIAALDASVADVTAPAD